MARAFDDGSSQYLQVSASPVIVPPITMACWFTRDSAAYDNVGLMCMGDADGIDMYYLLSSGDSATHYIYAWQAGGGADRNAITTPASTFSANTYYHAAAVFAATNDRRAYFNAGYEGTEATNLTTTNTDTLTIGARYRNAAYAHYMAGNIAEAAIWSAALTTTELGLLVKGYSPLFIRPQNLVFYVPLIRDNDEDIVGGLSLTATNSPTVSAHPRVFYPSVPILGKPSAAEEAVEEKLLQPILIRSNQIPIHQLQL